MLLSDISVTEYVRSCLFLSSELLFIAQKQNLLGDKHVERGEIFLSDASIPLPRPATIIAWASAFHLGPANGWWEWKPIPQKVELDLCQGKFLIPFLPALGWYEETGISLPRSAKAHKRDSQGNITWGAVWIADSSTGAIIEELDHGQYPVEEIIWDSTRPVGSYDTHWLPPMWEDFDSGWQFGVQQSVPGIPVTLRNPSEQLARGGIPFIRFIFPNNYVRRLLLRFTHIKYASNWAKSFTSSLHDWTPERAQQDSLRIVEMIERRINGKDEEELMKELVEAEAKRSALRKGLNGGIKRSTFLDADFFKGFNLD